MSHHSTTTYGIVSCQFSLETFYNLYLEQTRVAPTEDSLQAIKKVFEAFLKSLCYSASPFISAMTVSIPISVICANLGYQVKDDNSGAIPLSKVPDIPVALSVACVVHTMTRRNHESAVKRVFTTAQMVGFLFTFSVATYSQIEDSEDSWGNGFFNVVVPCLSVPPLTYYATKLFEDVIPYFFRCRR